MRKKNVYWIKLIIPDLSWLEYSSFKSFKELYRIVGSLDTWDLCCSCRWSSSIIATAAGIMILVAAELLIHILKNAVTPIKPAILLLNNHKKIVFILQIKKKNSIIDTIWLTNQQNEEQIMLIVDVNVHVP